MFAKTQGFKLLDAGSPSPFAAGVNPGEKKLVSTGVGGLSQFAPFDFEAALAGGVNQDSAIARQIHFNQFFRFVRTGGRRPNLASQRVEHGHEQVAVARGCVLGVVEAQGSRKLSAQEDVAILVQV